MRLRWRSTIHRALAWRRSRRTWSRCVAWRWLNRMIWLQPVIWLCRGRSISSGRWLRRTVIWHRLIRPVVRLGLIRFRSIIRLRRRRTISPGRWLRRTVVWHRLIRFRPVIRLRRRRAISPGRRLRRTVWRRLIRQRLTRLRTIVRLCHPRTVGFRLTIVRNRAIRLRGVCGWTLIRRWRIGWSVRGDIRRLAARPCGGRRGRPSRRRLPYLRTSSRRRICRLQMLHLLTCDWLSGMGCQRLLSRGKRHRRRRGFRLCDYRAARHRCRGSCHVVRCVCMRSKHAVGGGSNCRSGGHRGRGNFPCVNRDGGPANRLPAREGLLRNRCHSPRNILVHVGNVVDGGGLINDGRVVDVRNGRGADVGVADVYSVHITATHAIRRDVNFSRA
jgi:hypothetical protein